MVPTDDDLAGSTGPGADEASAPVVKRARRRAASRPAGPPVASSEDPVGSSVDAAVSEPGDSESGSGESGGRAARAPAKKTAKRTRKAAAPAVAKEPEAEAAPAADESGDQPPAVDEAPSKPARRTRKAAAKTAPAPETATGQVPEAAGAISASTVPLFVAPQEPPTQIGPAEDRVDEDGLADGATGEGAAGEGAAAEDVTAEDVTAEGAADEGAEDDDGPRRRRRRGGRGRRRRAEDASTEGADGEEPGESDADVDDSAPSSSEGSTDEDAAEEDGGSRRRRRRRRRGSGDSPDGSDDSGSTSGRSRESRGRGDDVTALRGSTRLEAKKQRRREGREAGRRRAPILTEAEFLARRESVDRVMAVRQNGDRTQIAVLEDGVLVEHYVTRGTSASMVGNVYLGRVQNVLPSMEAAFVDIGRGRNAVLYAGEVNWDAAGLDGQPKRIEFALKSGDPVLVQVTKDPVGQKGARLTSQISLPGRFLVYVPDGSMTGISRKLPDTERSRLKAILKRVMPEDAGVIVRTAAEGAAEDALEADIARLTAQWEDISTSAKSASPPSLLYSEPDLAIKVVRDIFNEDVSRLVVSGDTAWASLSAYIGAVAPDLAERLTHWVGPNDLFAEYRVDEQLLKALDRKVYLPSGGSLVIDRTEAMTVVDVNTGKFTGQGGTLEQTVTRNNLEAAEEIVRQLRLRDIGGIIVVDFIDMVLESNRDLVLRRLVECLGRDRTKHQVAEVTSLGLVQMTRKRIGSGLLESFSSTCEHCNGRGIKVALHAEPEAEASPRGRRPAGAVDPADVAARALAAADPDPEPTAPAEVTEPAEVTGPAEVAGAIEPAELTEVAHATEPVDQPV